MEANGFQVDSLNGLASFAVSVGYDRFDNKTMHTVLRCLLVERRLARNNATTTYLSIPYRYYYIIQYITTRIP